MCMIDGVICGFSLDDAFPFGLGRMGSTNSKKCRLSALSRYESNGRCQLGLCNMGIRL